MTRDIKKSIAEYEERFFGSKDKLLAAELFDLVQLSKTDDGDSTVIAAVNAWEAGYMAGYQRALKDLRKKTGK